MDTLTFFKRVLAGEPNHVLTLTRGKKIFWNRNYPTLEAAAQAALKFNTDGLTVYHALGSFAGNETVDDQQRPKVTRKAAQAVLFKSLACDIDVGAGKPHESQLAAAQSVARAVKSLGLPAPMLVSSGWGLHCYWPLTAAIDRATWSLISAALRDKLLAAGLALDTSKIADPAMVLRPVGTVNRKVSEHSQPVRLLRDCPDHVLSAIQACLGLAAGAAAPTPAPRATSGTPRRSAMLDAVLDSPALAPAVTRSARPKPPRFAPAGQSTQMIVGADGASDQQILTSADSLYGNYRMRRVYYSAFSPIPDASRALPLIAPPLVREHRLYQADWLMRFYGFDVGEIADGHENGMLPLDIDPKLAWALRNRQRFPLDVASASREELLRVPGFGRKAVDRIIATRRITSIRVADLARLHIPRNKALPFIVLSDHRPSARLLDTAGLVERFKPKATQLGFGF